MLNRSNPFADTLERPGETGQGWARPDKTSERTQGLEELFNWPQVAAFRQLSAFEVA